MRSLTLPPTCPTTFSSCTMAHSLSRSPSTTSPPIPRPSSHNPLPPPTSSIPNKILEHTEASSALLLPPSDSTSSDSTSKPPHCQTSHRRLFISHHMSLSVAGPSSLQLVGSGLDWNTEVYEPFLEYQVSYGVLEAKFLSLSLPKPSLQVNTARELSKHTLDVFSLAKESHELSHCLWSNMDWQGS